MACSSGTSTGSSTATTTTTTTTTTMVQNSGSEGDLQLVMDQRRKKRMLSNRESARRSRMRKQKHLDDLVAQVTQLKSENSHILTTYKATTQQYLALETENSVMRAQIMELSTRLESLNEIMTCMNGNNMDEYDGAPPAMDMMMNPWNLMSINQPIMASPDMFLY